MGTSILEIMIMLALPALGAERGGLSPPVKLEAGGQPIEVEVGHAAPLVADFDGDGLKDLLVGQFGGGKLRIYRNSGTNVEPRFDGFEWFQAGGTVGVVPVG